MTLLVAILVVAALLAGFLFVTSVEARRGVRFFGRSRAALDASVMKAASIVKTEAGAAPIATIRTLLEHLIHEIVRGVLFLVRGLERGLTRIVHILRARRVRRAWEGAEDEKTSSVE